MEYEEARERRAKIEARREQLTVEMKSFESIRDQALRGEFGMYGGANGGDDEEDGFEVVELKTLDHTVWM